MEVNLDSVTGMPNTSINTLTNLGQNPIVMGIALVVSILFVVLFMSLGSGDSSGDSGSSGSSGSSSGSSGGKFMEILLWSIFIVLLLLNGLSYIFNLNITTSLTNLFSTKPDMKVIVHPQNIIGEDTAQPIASASTPEVFHVPGNKYTYENAKAVCSAYGSRLANIKEIDAAYTDGGDWCSFGWSENQMALYPTQYAKWQKLQAIEGHKHDCGRPGINGGFIDNPNIKFGINCFGLKPAINADEIQAMNVTPLYPKTQKEINFEKKVDYWREKLPEIAIAPFNHDNWSII